MITFTIDGREVSAPENAMLVDGAKHGDIEIPVFCYEPKLGQPVGACRMCLVEVEGIPKLQTACSTPVKDGMVVHTQTARVRQAQEAVVEFLLVNHPLDCPVCDKGGECPLQDITFGWGGGKSRFIEPKRHFRKPLELSPLVAIDRERCILCYRCVRFSQEIAEDHQLVLEERGAHSYVGTFDGHPYVAPFSGNIVELCPVGALTSIPYRFRARPWDIEGAGSVCTLCPAQCNVELTVRNDRVLRVLARDHADVDDGWLCDKGRFAYQSMHVEERITDPLLREGDMLRIVSWERAFEAAAAGLGRARGRAAAIVGGETTNEEGFLLARLMRGALESPHVDCRAGGAVPLELHQALAAPALQATVPDLEFAHAVLVLDCEPLDDAPVIDLRIRKGVRQHGAQLAVATSRPSALDGNAKLALRFAPGAVEALLCALDAALGGAKDLDELAAAAGTTADEVRSLATLLKRAGDDVAIVWGEHLADGPRGAHALRALLNVAARLGLADSDGAGLLELPAETNGRGLREAGVLPNAGPGLAPPDSEGHAAPEIAAALAAGELSAVYLLHADPLRTHPDRPLWERALDKASTVIAHESVMTDSIREHATVVFPAEAYAEKEGTLTHPDGRLQRLRPAIGHPQTTRTEWRVLAELSARLGDDPRVEKDVELTAQLAEAVPFYAGITLDEIGGRGVRWQERDAASALPSAELGPFELERPLAAPSPNGALRLGTFRSIWASKEIEISPALKFLVPHQRAELSPADAERLGVGDGDMVEVAYDGALVHAQATVRTAVPTGTVFLEIATPAESANALTNGEPRLVEVRRA
jgi:NADH-quinone oxidoreductase subunit G